MLGAAYQLGATLGAVEIDAAVGRQSANAINVLNAYRSNGGLPAIVIIDIGNNGTLTPHQIDTVMDALEGVTKVIFVTVRVDRPWVGANNANIWDARGRHPNIYIADWHATSIGHPEYFQGDGIHLRPEGAQAFAELLGGSAAGYRVIESTSAISSGVSRQLPDSTFCCTCSGRVAPAITLATNG